MQPCLELDAKKDVHQNTMSECWSLVACWLFLAQYRYLRKYNVLTCIIYGLM